MYSPHPNCNNIDLPFPKQVQEQVESMMAAKMKKEEEKKKKKEERKKKRGPRMSGSRGEL